MSNIYELPKEIDQALIAYYNCFDEDTGEQIVTDEEVEAANKSLFELQNRKEELLEWYLKDRANRIADNAWLQNEISRLQERIKANDKKIQRVEKIVDFNFKDDYDGKPIHYGNFTVNYTKSKQTVFTDESLIPEKFINRSTVEVVKIPKADIKKAIDSGEEVPWVEIKENLKLKIK